MQANFGFIELSDLKIERQGSTRNIRILPEFPNSVMKTIRPECVDKRGRLFGKGKLQKTRPLGCYSSTHRELEEYIIQRRLHHANTTIKLPIAHIHGIPMTSEGLGLLVEKITNCSGELAPTIAQLGKLRQIDNKHLLAIEKLRLSCVTNHIVIGDLHAGNIVYTETRSNTPECVCIDGYGEKALIPVHRWNARVNARRINKKINGILKWIKLNH